MTTIHLGCECGAVTGEIIGIAPHSGNHIVCYCDDCQQFSKELNQAEKTLNEYGGTEIYQVPLSSVNITQGKDHLALMNLKPKGLNRWYADCCNTPIGNTVSPALPLFGVIHTFVKDDAFPSKAGPIIGSHLIKYATGRIPQEQLGPKGHIALLLRVMRTLLTWKLKGKGKNETFFDKQGQPVKSPNICSS